MLILAIVTIGGVVLNYSKMDKKIIKPILAEDDEEEEEEEDEEDDERFEVIDTTPTKNETKKNETKTVTTKLADTITQTTSTTIRHDSDGDGKYDDADPHPTINEYFIVADANLNGIDDKYEQQ